MRVVDQFAAGFGFTILLSVHVYRLRDNGRLLVLFFLDQIPYSLLFGFHGTSSAILFTEILALVGVALRGNVVFSFFDLLHRIVAPLSLVHLTLLPPLLLILFVFLAMLLLLTFGNRSL